MIRVAVVYVVAGWIIIEVASTVLPPLNLPPWSVKLVIVLIALGFPIAVIMGWMFDPGPHGADPNSAAPETMTRAPPASLTAAPVPTGTLDAARPPARSESDRRTEMAQAPRSDFCWSTGQIALEARCLPPSTFQCTL